MIGKSDEVVYIYIQVKLQNALLEDGKFQRRVVSHEVHLQVNKSILNFPVGINAGYFGSFSNKEKFLLNIKSLVVGPSMLTVQMVQSSLISLGCRSSSNKLARVLS